MIKELYIQRVPTAGFFEDLNPEVATALEAALEVLGELTAGVRDVDVPVAGSVTDIWNPEIYTGSLMRMSRRMANLTI